ncbi:OPT superfamily [Sorochytrium milnesiophthora]
MGVDATDKDLEKHSLEEKDIDKKPSGFVVDDEFATTVSAMIPSTDNIDTPSFTFRVLVIGTLFCCAFSFVNQLMLFRTNPLTINAYLAVLLGYPLGRVMAATIPSASFNLPYFGVCSLNPGPFTIKETVLIYIMASTGAAGIYGTDNLFVQKYYYNLELSPLASIGFLLATMLTGFGVAGVCQNILVRPAHMIWPSALPQIALFQSFHAGDNTDKDPNVGENGRRHMPRLMFFGIAVTAVFVYQFIPNIVAPAIGAIGLLCLFTKDPATQVIGSPAVGTGVLALSFDWGNISSKLSPITNPFWVQVNGLLCALIFQWILIPASWKGRWFGGPLLQIPLNTGALVNKDGVGFKPAALINVTTHIMDEAKYAAYAPFYASPFFIWCYFGSFASFAGAVSHVAVWFGKDIIRRLRASREDLNEHDIHCQLIDKYPRVPLTWYAAFFVVPTIIGIVVCHASGIQMPWYYSLLSIVVAIIGTIPFAFVLATAGVQLFMNVISEFVVGCMNPGYPIVMMAFKCFSVTVSQSVLTLLQDLKVGHYMKIAPRHIFAAQMYSQIVSVFFAYISLEVWTANDEHVDWVLNYTKYKKTPIAKDWSSQSVMAVYYNASLLWGAIGPIRFFMTSYTPILIGGFLSGLALPILMKLGHVFIGGRFPWALVSAPLLFSIPAPGSSNSGTIMAFGFSVAFQFFAYRYRKKWWQRYNYVLATAFDVGTVLCNLVVVYVLNTLNVKAPDWALGDAAGDFCPNVDTEYKILGGKA